MSYCESKPDFLVLLNMKLSHRMVEGREWDRNPVSANPLIVSQNRILAYSRSDHINPSILSVPHAGPLYALCYLWIWLFHVIREKIPCQHAFTFNLCCRQELPYHRYGNRLMERAEPILWYFSIFYLAHILGYFLYEWCNSMYWSVFLTLWYWNIICILV